MGWLAGLLSRALGALLQTHVAPVVSAVGEAFPAAMNGDMEEGRVRGAHEHFRVLCKLFTELRGSDDAERSQVGVEEAYCASRALLWGLWEVVVAGLREAQPGGRGHLPKRTG